MGQRHEGTIEEREDLLVVALSQFLDRSPPSEQIRQTLEHVGDRMQRRETGPHDGLARGIVCRAEVEGFAH